MFPPAQGLRLDIDAISQIFGSISIACWIVVFSPQIIENWRRSSAEGLSVVFIVVWLLGDFFNIFGAVLQGVLPTMIILAVYYTVADIVLLLQCFWYKGFTLRDEVKTPVDSGSSDEEESSSPDSEDSPLLHREHRTNGHSHSHHTRPSITDADRRHSSHSQSSFRERYLSIDGTHLSPVTPLLDGQHNHHQPSTPRPEPRPSSALQSALFNLATIIIVCFAGIFGWYLSVRNKPPPSHHNPVHPAPEDDTTLHFSLWGQIFGYICAALYLGSRVPQLLLNYRRKSTDGISMLFFLFACLGNLTYVLSIMVYNPRCQHKKCEAGEAAAIYWRYMAVNASWLLGSFGTLLLDAGVFVQYFMYRVEESDDEEDEE